MAVRVWFEFPTHLPGARSLLRIGGAWPGGGFTGFSVNGPLEPADLPQEEIEGRDLMNLDQATRRIGVTPKGFCGIDWSGWVLRRQAHAKIGNPERPEDRPEAIKHIGRVMRNVIDCSPGATFTLAYINHEAGGDPEWVRDSLLSQLPETIPTMVTGITTGAFPMYNKWGEIPRLKGEFNGRPLVAYADGWLCSPEWNRPRYANTKLGSVWNSFIDAVNQIISIRAAGAIPVPNVQGIGVIDYDHSKTRNTTPFERAVYMHLAEAYSILGVKDVVCFNSSGRGAHLKDPVCDFARMIVEDADTLDAFTKTNRAAWIRPKAPIPLDTPRFKLGGMWFDLSAVNELAVAMSL